MPSTIPTASVRLRRLVSATLFAAAAALGISTLADPAIASAARDWDIGEYEDCVDWWYDHTDDAGTGDQERRRLVNPATLLGGVPVFIPAPAWLRDRTRSPVPSMSRLLMAC